MENKKNETSVKTDNKLNKQEKRRYQIIIAFLIVVIAVLIFFLIYIKSNVNTIIIEKEKVILETISLRNELDSILFEHEKIKEDYGHLSEVLSEQDSLIIVQVKEIEKLIASQADYRRIRRQLDHLRGITQGYVSQIDSLYTVTLVLAEEKNVLEKDLKKERLITVDLTKDKEDLEKQITSAAVLRAYNINLTALTLGWQNREKETDKARRTDVIRACFTIGENLLVSSGTKDVYIRIARPEDNLILTQGGYSFIYKGERIQYSEKTTIDYNHKSQNLCIAYSNPDIEFMPGEYNISLFADDNEIGKAKFELK